MAASGCTCLTGNWKSTNSFNQPETIWNKGHHLGTCIPSSWHSDTLIVSKCMILYLTEYWSLEDWELKINNHNDKLVLHCSLKEKKGPGNQWEKWWLVVEGGSYYIFARRCPEHPGKASNRLYGEGRFRIWGVVVEGTAVLGECWHTPLAASWSRLIECSSQPWGLLTSRSCLSP